MFGLFKKKKGKADYAVETAVGLLQIQMAFADSEDNKKLTEEYGRGYIFGLCDGLFQSIGVEDDAKVISMLTTVHITIFGEENGTNVIAQSIRDQAEPIFVKGRMRGGEELVEFSRNKTPAMGLARYLLNGEMR